MRKNFLLGCIIILSYFNYAQVGINTEPVHSSAALDMSDSKKGVLAPRIALTHERDRSIISEPKKGLLVFNTTENAQNEFRILLLKQRKMGAILQFN